MKLLKRIAGRSQLEYEARIAPWIAKYLFWLYLPLYWLCQKYQIVFVVNIAAGTGHIIAELDYFFRRLETEEINPHKRYIWVRKPDVFSLSCVEFYGDRFYKAICNHFLYHLLLPFTMAFPKVTFDAGLSRLKWQLTPDRKYFKPLPRQTYLYQLSKKEGIALWCTYYQLRQKTLSAYPLVHGKFPITELPFLKESDKVALIHIKTDTINATALPTDPNTYLPAMNHLLKQGYRLVFAGREKMPALFKDLPIFNYAESSFAHFRNDILLFNRSELAIVGGSGISFLADCYGKPYLYLNSWHLPMAMFSPKCTIVPALIQKSTGEFLSLPEQIALYHSLEDKGAEVFPRNYQARNASSDEILAALQELLSPPSTSPLQIRYRTLHPDSPLTFVGSRCSHYFLEKHANLLPETL